jgi:hypothetical protein
MSYMRQRFLILGLTLFCTVALGQLVQQGQLVGTPASSGSDMGAAVAISGDGNTAIIGGLFDNSGQGSAWVFTRTTGIWTQQARLTASGAIGTADFGSAVGLSNDGNTAVIGGSFDNSGAGAAWIFTRSNGVWTQQTKLTATGAIGKPGLGARAAISADGAAVVLSGPLDNQTSQIPIGAAWVFAQINGIWSQQAKLVGSGYSGMPGEAGSVAISGDGKTVLIGGQSDNNSAGAAWIFTNNNGTWAQQGGKLTGSGALGSAAAFGIGAGLSFDGNTAVVSGFNDNSPMGNFGAGAAWVFTRSNGQWSQQVKLVAPDTVSGTATTNGSALGLTAAMSQDGNTVVATGYTAAWVFKRANGAWAKTQTVSVPGPSNQGISSAASADGNTIILGRPNMSGGGSAFVFAAPPVPPAPTGISPTSGSGLSGSLTFTFNDAIGVQAFTVVDVLIRDSLDGRHACYAAFQPSTGSVFLVDDAGDAGGPFAGMVLPTASSVSNSQCTINGTGTSFSASGNLLSLTLNITFAVGFAGNKVIYLSAQDAFGTLGWFAMGTWSVPGFSFSGPGVGGVTPGYSNVLTQSLQFTFTDTNGFQDISVANVLINGSLDGRHACYVAMTPITASSYSVLLVDDAGDSGGPFAGMVIPGSATVSNSQCSIAGAGSAVSANGSMLTITLPITFTNSFAGNQTIFAAARNILGGNSNWQAIGIAAIP